MRSHVLAVLLIALAASGVPGQDRGAASPAEARAKAKELARRIPAKDLTVSVPGERPSARRPPAVLTSAEELAAAVSPMEAAAGLQKQLDFTQEKLVVFSWSGRRKEVVGPSRVETEGKAATVVFTFTRDGGTGSERYEHILLYAVPKDAGVKVEVNPNVPK